MTFEDVIIVDPLVKDTLESIDKLVKTQEDLALPVNHNVQLFRFCRTTIIAQVRMIHHLKGLLDQKDSLTRPYDTLLGQFREE